MNYCPFCGVKVRHIKTIFDPFGEPLDILLCEECGRRFLYKGGEDWYIEEAET